jgi:hypothetical protein
MIVQQLDGHVKFQWPVFTSLTFIDISQKRQTPQWLREQRQTGHGSGTKG